MAVQPRDEKLVTCPYCRARVSLDEAFSSPIVVGGREAQGYVCPNCEDPFTVSEDRGILRALAPPLLTRTRRRTPRTGGPTA